MSVKFVSEGPDDEKVVVNRNSCPVCAQPDQECSLIVMSYKSISKAKRKFQLKCVKCLTPFSITTKDTSYDEPDDSPE
jgi:hypothetical protein